MISGMAAMGLPAFLGIVIQNHREKRHHEFNAIQSVMGKPSGAFPNQCAIRMSVALDKSRVNTASFDTMFPNRRCYQGFKHTPRHILAAQELADWMKSQKTIFGDVSKIDKQKINQSLIGKKGIVFIKDGWGATDHIDVWNGVVMQAGNPSYFSLGKEVWFWEAK